MPAQREQFELQGGPLREIMEAQVLAADSLKAQRKTTPPKVAFKELPEAKRIR